MRITVVGAGAMGTLVAARLSNTVAPDAGGGAPYEHPTRVVLYGRPGEHLDTVARDGVSLTERDGTTNPVKLHATSDAAEVEGSDLVICLVKAWASGESVAPLKSYLTRDTIVLTLQNGLGNAAQLRSALLHEGVRPHVWLGVTTQAAIRTGPGAITHTGSGITVIGRKSSEVNPRLRQVAATLTNGSWQTSAVDDIHRWVWRKLAVNAAINPVTALAGVPNRAIRENGELQKAARIIASEVAAVATARGISLDTKELIAAVNDVAGATGDNRSSMLVDLESGMRTEIDAINGAIVSEARRHGIPVPANQLMTALVHARERQQQAK